MTPAQTKDANTEALVDMLFGGSFDPRNAVAKLCVSNSERARSVPKKKKKKSADATTSSNGRESVTPTADERAAAAASIQYAATPKAQPSDVQSAPKRRKIEPESTHHDVKAASATMRHPKQPKKKKPARMLPTLGFGTAPQVADEEERTDPKPKPTPKPKEAPIKFSRLPAVEPTGPHDIRVQLENMSSSGSGGVSKTTRDHVTCLPLHADAYVDYVLCRPTARSAVETWTPYSTTVTDAMNPVALLASAGMGFSEALIALNSMVAGYAFYTGAWQALLDVTKQPSTGRELVVRTLTVLKDALCESPDVQVLLLHAVGCAFARYEEDCARAVPMVRALAKSPRHPDELRRLLTPGAVVGFAACARLICATAAGKRKSVFADVMRRVVNAHAED